MIGKHHVIIETDRLKYEFNIRRNITVIQGDSATGKTTLISLLDAYSRRGSNSGVRLQSDVPCVVYAGDGDHWKPFLASISSSIVFFDEDYSFVLSEEFASFVSSTDNYYVFITRRALTNLPYSVKEIYGIRTSGKFHFPTQVYHEFYPIYDETLSKPEGDGWILLVEDGKAGYEFFHNVCAETCCISAEGNSNIKRRLLEVLESGSVTVIADGAAFGAYVEDVVRIKGEQDNIVLYFPESFEWLILKSGVITDSEIPDILAQPEAYIDSNEYLSWERYFTELLENKTAGDNYRQYRKARLNKYYLSESAKRKILDVLPEEIQSILQ